jgi:hypothetical protein
MNVTGIPEGRLFPADIFCQIFFNGSWCLYIRDPDAGIDHLDFIFLFNFPSYLSHPGERVIG